MQWCMLQKFKAYSCVQMIFFGERCPPADITMTSWWKVLAKWYMIFRPHLIQLFFSPMDKTPLKNLISQNQRVLVQKVEKVKIEDYKKRSRLLKVVLSKANNMMENKLFPTINKWERTPFRGSGAPTEHHWWKGISL